MNAPRKGITRHQAVERVLQGIKDDSTAYVELLALLEEQFQATLRHQNAQLKVLADQIVAAVAAIDGRRRQRVTLVTALLGPRPDMQQFFALLPETARATSLADWSALEEMVLECKRRNIRNGTLLTEQFSTMQRVLNGEEHTYAPV